MKGWSILLLLGFIIGAIGYEKINKQESILQYYQQNSQFPILHLYHNRHFSKSRQFEDFLQVLEETQYRNRDYARFVLTDCELVKDAEIYACDNLKKTKDNRLIVGYYPSSQFINYGGKMLQNPPKNNVYDDHGSDIYTVEDLESFLTQMVPNFFKQLTNIDKFEEFKLPKYSPKLIFATKEDGVPQVIRKLGVHFFLKFQLGYVSDLTQSIINELNITKFPTLLVYKYNFHTETYQTFTYASSDFSSDSYEDVKNFLSPLALKQPRNDYLFHKILPPTKSQIITVDSRGDLLELMDKSSRWALISEYNTTPEKLIAAREKYGLFFQYYHALISDVTTQKISLFDPAKKKTYLLPKYDVQFRPLTLEDFNSNVTLWLNKNFIVVGVREQYGHICTLSQGILFRGLARCLIIREEDRQEAGKILGMQIDIGFVSHEKIENGRRRVTGQSFENTEFQTIYRTMEYELKIKSQLIIDDFMDRPIKPIQSSHKLRQICAFPTKKCGLVFVDSNKKDKTMRDYVAQVAKNFINEYLFYEIDVNCNLQFLEEIEGLQKNRGGLVVYHPNTSTYVYLKAKLSKSNIEKFLNINLTENKKIPKNKFKNADIIAKACQPAKNQKGEQSGENDSL